MDFPRILVQGWPWEMGGGRVHQEACKRSHCQVLRPKPSSGWGGGKRGGRKEWIHSVWDVLASVGFNCKLGEGRDFGLFCSYSFPHPQESAWHVASI